MSKSCKWKSLGHTFARDSLVPRLLEAPWDWPLSTPWGFLVPCGTPGQAPVRAVPIAPPAFFCHILGDTWGSCSVLHPVKTVFSHSVGVSVTVIAGVMI